MNWNEMLLYSFFNSGCEMKINEIILHDDREMRWNEVKFMKINETRPWETTKRFIEFYQKSARRARRQRYRHRNFSPQAGRLTIRHGILNNWTWCSGNSWRSTSWLALHCRFGLNRACLLVSINVCIGLTSLSSPLACASKKWRDTIHELLH